MTDQHSIEIMARAMCERDPDASAEALGPGKRVWQAYSSVATKAFIALRAAGYAVVPREPTKAMIRVGGEEIYAWDPTADKPLRTNVNGISDGNSCLAEAEDLCDQAWRAMIEAAEQPPTGAADG